MLSLLLIHSRPFFSGCGRRVEDTIDDIVAGRLLVEDLPKICVLTDLEGNYFSLNNRRLYVLKHLRNTGFLETLDPPNMIRVRFKAALPREIKKYSVANCSLHCSIMHERGREDKDCEEFEENTTPPSTEMIPGMNFDSLMQSLPLSAREEVKKAMKLQQQGKSKQSSLLLTKLFERKLISKDVLDVVVAYVLNS